MPVFERRVENVLWNPQADGILACTSHTDVKIYDVTGADAKLAFGWLTDKITILIFSLF